jgi:hypothetical protein
MTTRRVLASRGIAFLLAPLAFGCGSSAIKHNPAGNGGGGNTTVAGTTGAAGGASSVGGSTESSVGGNPGATGGDSGATGGAMITGGSTTSATGGATSAAGSTGTGGSTAVDCNAPLTIPPLCTGTAPSAALISDFSIATGSTGPVLFGTWGQSVYGGAYTYPVANPNPGPCDGTPSAYPLTQDLTGGNWHITGTVGTYSGGGLWWECNTATSAKVAYASACTLDASAYTGISFTVSGNAGPAVSPATTGAIAFSVSQPSTMKPKLDSAGNPKTCGACTAASCGSAVSVPVATTATPVTLTWAQLGVTTPNAISAIAFQFLDPCSLNNGYATSPCTPTTFPVDMTIADIQFTTN